MYISLFYVAGAVIFKSKRLRKATENVMLTEPRPGFKPGSPKMTIRHITAIRNGGIIIQL
jgi:hypothetical protein